MKILRMGSALPHVSNQESVKTICPKCGTKVKLDGDEYTYSCEKHYIYWDCPLCGNVESHRTLTLKEHLVNGLCACLTTVFAIIEHIMEYWHVYLCIGLVGLVVGGCTVGISTLPDEQDLAQDAPYKFYIREIGSTYVRDYRSQIEPYVNDNGELIYVDVYGEYRILDGYELIDVVEQKEDKNETD